MGKGGGGTDNETQGEGGGMQGEGGVGWQLVANALYLLAWLAGWSSHPWGSKVSAILWVCCSAAPALALWLDKKDKSYFCPSKVHFWHLDHSKRPFLYI